MKQLFILFSILFASTIKLIAQAPPQGINYQAVVYMDGSDSQPGTNISGQLLTKQNISVQFSILKASATGAVAYKEIHQVETDEFGMFSLIIGQGNSNGTGAFPAIDWGADIYFLKVELDKKAGADFKLMSTQQLWSVPYSLYSEEASYAENAGNGITIITDNGDGTITITYFDGTTYTSPVLSGLTGPQGIQGPIGLQGAAGANGQNTLAKTTTETAGTNCATGGIKVEYGLDVNSNNILDATEINGSLTKYICNGTTGATGPQGIQGVAGTTGAIGATGAAGKNTLAKTTTETAGANCATGGVKVEYGLDVNSNNVLDATEINATLTKYICNGTVGATGATGPQGIQGVAGATGATGAAGKNTLAKTTTETAGANCATGGVKVEYGLDLNSNNVLDATEINATLTKYICNGTAGATGAQGIQGVAGTAGAAGKNTLAKTTTQTAGANCATGGVKVEYGLDVNSNNVLDVTEINATLTKYICNGTVGATGATGPQGIQGVAGTAGAAGAAGKNTLAKTTTETAGANCATGGVKVEYGLDVNSNNVLDVTEINATLTKYICNGTAGATGPAGPTGLTGATGAQGIQGVAGTAGATGAAGKNTLAKTTTETAGANCATGGVKVEYGLDVNSNNVLDVTEINATLTKYICNGTAGATGPTGPTGLTGATGAQGIQGVAGTAGATGAAGKNTLAKTTTETAGANCATGGVKVEYGLDINSNNVLDATEINVTLTKYICNGTAGATGATGPIGLTGATGAQGIQGVAGIAGAAGAVGKNTLAKTTTETAGANCATGGVKVEYGLDANSNNVLDATEITATLTKYICNGTAGATGAQGPTGLTGATGAQGIQGVAGTAGAAGAVGKNTLAKTTTETAGANCATGGLKVEYGLDANSNNVLDATEINATLTKYICNGTAGATGAQGPIGLTGPQGLTGATGPQGVQGISGTNGTNGTNGLDGKNTLAKTTTEVAGINCATGGVKVEYGLDANSNNILDASEINATLTKYICNGTAGATGTQGIAGTNGINGQNGLNALIKTTVEAAGANCANGGTKIETGLDANSNGILDVVEVNTSQTQFVCNGNSGTNAVSTSYPSNSIKLGFNTTTTWLCPVNVTKIRVEVWGAGGGGGGGSGGDISCMAWTGMGYWGGYGGTGGLGGYNCDTISVIPGQSYSIIVGSGGTGGNVVSCGTGETGGTGGFTSFNGIITANGGTGGLGSPSQNGATTGYGPLAGTSGTISNYIYSTSSIPTANYIPNTILTASPGFASGGSGGQECRSNMPASYMNMTPTPGQNGQNGFCVISY